MSDISVTAAAALAARKARSRQPVLDDLAKIVSSRDGAITVRQIEVVASVLSYAVTATELYSTLVGWLAHNQVTADTARPFWDSPAWVDILTRAQDAELGLRRGHRPKGGEARRVDPRKDWSIPKITVAFGIGDTEAKLLGLRKLVSNRLRKAEERVTEGAALGRVGRPKRINRPGAEQGVSLRTLQRREKAAKEAVLAEKVGRVTAVSRNSALSRATDGKAEAEVSPSGQGDQHYNDTVEFRDTAGLTYYDEVSPHPARPARPSHDRPKDWMLRTAEARRLAALAERLGLTVNERVRSRDSSDWWSVPPGLELAEVDAAELEAAIDAANRAERRRNAMAFAEARKVEARRRAGMKFDPDIRPEAVTTGDWALMPPYQRLAAAEHAAKVALARDMAAASTAVVADPNACPKSVSPDLWGAVAERLRPEALRFAGLLWLGGWGPDDAVAQGAEIAARAEALSVAVMAVRPDFEEDRVKAASLALWWMATREAMPCVIAKMMEHDGAEPLQSAREEETMREFMRRVRFEVFADPTKTGKELGEEIIAEAGRMLADDSRLADRGPYVVAFLARLAVSKT